MELYAYKFRLYLSSVQKAIIDKRVKEMQTDKKTKEEVAEINNER